MSQNLNTSTNANASKNRATIFMAAIVVAIVAILLAVYYAIPMDSHILASGAGAHYKHAAAFFAIAIICAIGAAVTRPKRAA
jgi:hypothetical protein